MPASRTGRNRRDTVTRNVLHVMLCVRGARARRVVGGVYSEFGADRFRIRARRRPGVLTRAWRTHMTDVSTRAVLPAQGTSPELTLTPEPPENPLRPGQRLAPFQADLHPPQGIGSPPTGCTSSTSH